ncbi:MAG: hypothetical protein H4O13_04775 [Xanthomonadales bacterium]|nr:hypothetical protein [Xanthomonadales bacterium]
MIAALNVPTSFELGNPGASNTLYISSDPADNQATLSVTFGAATTLTPGTLVPYESAGASAQTLIYLDLTALQLDAATLQALLLTAEGWTSAAYAQDNMVAITPVSTVEVAAGQTVSFALTGFVLPDSPGTPTVAINLDIFHVPGIATGPYAAMYSTSVALAYPASGKQDLHDVLEFRISPDTVNLSTPSYPPVANQLQLILAPKDGQPTVNAGAQTVFNLSVVYAADAVGYGALMTPEQGSAISIPQPQGTQWSISNVAGTAGRSWNFTLPEGQAIPSAGGQPVAFDFSPLVSSLRPGPTLVLLSYSGVPGYKDGTFSFTLQKQPHVQIIDFHVTPPLSELTGGSAAVTLNWTTADATSLELQPGNHNVTGLTSFPTTIDRTTTFSLTAYGAGGPARNNSAIASTKAMVVPVLNRLTATPGAIAADDFSSGSATVNLSWALNAGAGTALQLESSETGVIGQNFSALASTDANITEPQMYTLSITGQLDPLQRWKCYVPAFQLQQKVAAVGQAMAGPVAAPGASYVAAGMAGGRVSIRSTASYQEIASVTVGGQPKSIAFAPDGSAFYAADAAGGAVVAVAVTTTTDTPPWSFEAGTSFAVGGTPGQLAMAPGGMLYAAVANGASPGWLAAIDTVAGTVTRVAAGTGTSGVAALPSGAQVFVSNTADGTVSQFGRAIDGSYQAIQTIANLPGAAGLAVTPDANSLVVGCGDGTVRILDATMPTVANQAVVNVGGKPTAVALDPSGTYAFALDTANGRIAMISLAKRALIGAPVTVAAGSTDISISPDGMIALVGGPSLSVVSLQTYLGQPASANCNGLISNAVASPDLQRVFAWADASVSHSHIQPAVGLQVYGVQSQTVTPVFKDRKIIGLTVPTLPSFNTGFLSILGQSGCYPLDCVGLQLGDPVAMPPKGGVAMRQPLGLASSADGQTVFTVSRDGDNAYSLVVIQAQAGGSWQVTADVPLYTASFNALSVPLVAAPDGSAAYVYDSTNGQVWVATRDGAGNVSVNPSPLAAPGQIAQGFVMAGDGRKAYLAVQQGANTVFYVIDTAAKAIQAFPLTEPVSTVSIQSMAISPDGTRLFATDQTNGSVRVIDTLSLRFLQTITWPTSLSLPMGIAVSGDQSRLFVATGSGRLTVAGQVRPMPRAARATRLFRALATGPQQKGVFIRHQPGDTPGHNGGTFSACPDIVLSVDAQNRPALLDPTTLITDLGYAKDFGNAVSQGQVNYVYLRGLNNASSFNPPPDVDPRFWLAYAVSNIVLWPNQWMTDKITVGTVGQNYQDSTNIIYNNATAGQLMTTKQPFLWSPPVLTDGNHYCLISMAENPQDSPPWQPDPGNFQSFNDLVTFILTNDWFGWRNTQAVQRTLPTWQKKFPIAGPPSPGIAQVGVKCTNMPIGAQFQFTVPGPNGKTDGLNTDVLTISDPNQTYTLPMMFPANFDTYMVLTYYQNGAPQPPTGSSLICYLGQSSKQLQSFMSLERIRRRPVRAINLATGHWDTVHPLGSMSVVFT